MTTVSIELSFKKVALCAGATWKLIPLGEFFNAVSMSRLEMSDATTLAPLLKNKLEKYP